jgi:hypothetical protein
MATKITPQPPVVQSSVWYDLLATIEYIVDGSGRTKCARQLLYPVLVAAVLIAASATVIVIFAGPSWVIGAVGLATGAVSRRRIRCHLRCRVGPACPLPCQREEGLRGPAQQ